MKSATIKKNTYFVAIGQIAQKVLAFALVPLAARGLGDDGFGIYSLAGAIMYFVLLMNDIGINHYITREIAKDRSQAQNTFYHAFLIKLLMIGINIPLLLLFLKLTNYPGQADTAILILSGYGILSSMIQLVIGIFQAHEVMKYEALIYTIEKSAITALAVFTLLMKWGLLVFCGTFLVGGFLSLSLGLMILFRVFRFRLGTFHLDLSFVRRLFVEGMPFGLSLILASVYSYIGILVLSFLEGPEVIGWYSAAFRLIALTTIIPMILVGSTYPALSRFGAEPNSQKTDLVYRCVKYLTFMALPLIAGATVLSTGVINLVYGVDYTHSIVILRILVWAAALIFYNYFLGGFLKAMNAQKRLVRIQVWGLIVNLVMNVILIQYYSFTGAAYATVLTEGFIFIACLIAASRFVARLPEYQFIGKTLIATCGMIGVALLARAIHILPLILICVITYTLILYGIKGFTLQEIVPFRMQKWMNRA
ncbi:flippase [candidate division KSB1 bacterium]|nr:flippase [candidate division KSB1 bacterium]